MDIKLIFAALTLHFFALITPGPDFVLTVKNTLQLGKLLGFATALGITLGITLHISYSIAGVALLLNEFPGVYNFVRYAGAIYLIWLGASSLWALRYQQRAQEIVQKNTKGKNFRECLAQGFLTNILNPKATLFVLGLYTSIIRPGTTHASLLTAGAGMLTMTAVWFSFVAWVFSIKHIREMYFKVKKLLNFLFGIFFVGTGILLILGL